MAENMDLKQLCERQTRALDGLQRGQHDPETNLEVNMQSNSELKEVIMRLDSELRREKSHSNLFKEQFRAGPASEEEAKLDFNDRLDESINGQLFPRKSRVYSHNIQI